MLNRILRLMLVLLLVSAMPLASYANNNATTSNEANAQAEGRVAAIVFSVISFVAFVGAMASCTCEARMGEQRAQAHRRARMATNILLGVSGASGVVGFLTALLTGNS